MGETAVLETNTSPGFLLPVYYTDFVGYFDAKREPQMEEILFVVVEISIC